MENNKLKPSRIIGVVSKHAGALVGAAVVTGRRVELCVRNMMTAEKGPSSRVAKKPVQVQVEKKASVTGAKKTESEQAKIVKKPVQVRTKKKKRKTGKKKSEGKEAKIKRKTGKPKGPSRSRSRPTSKSQAKMSGDKSRKTTTSTGSVS